MPGKFLSLFGSESYVSVHSKIVCKNGRFNNIVLKTQRFFWFQNKVFKKIQSLSTCAAVLLVIFMDSKIELGNKSYLEKFGELFGTSPY